MLEDALFTRERCCQQPRSRPLPRRPPRGSAGGPRSPCPERTGRAAGRDRAIFEKPKAAPKRKFATKCDHQCDESHQLNRASVWADLPKHITASVDFNSLRCDWIILPSVYIKGLLPSGVLARDEGPLCTSPFTPRPHLLREEGEEGGQTPSCLPRSPGRQVYNSTEGNAKLPRSPVIESDRILRPAGWSLSAYDSMRREESPVGTRASGEKMKTEHSY